MGKYSQEQVDDLDDSYELYEQPLPTPVQWKDAQERAAAIFGVTTPPLLSVTNVSALGKLVQEQAKLNKDSCFNLVLRLQNRLPAFGLDVAATNRGKTAAATLSLAKELERAPVDTAAVLLAGANVATSASAMGTSLKSAAKIVAAIDGTQWQLLDSLKQLSDDRKEAATGVLASVKQALEADELAQGLEAALKSAIVQATALLGNSMPSHWQRAAKSETTF